MPGPLYAFPSLPYPTDLPTPVLAVPTHIDMPTQPPWPPRPALPAPSDFSPLAPALQSFRLPRPKLACPARPTSLACPWQLPPSTRHPAPTAQPGTDLPGFRVSPTPIRHASPRLRAQPGPFRATSQGRPSPPAPDRQTKPTHVASPRSVTDNPNQCASAPSGPDLPTPAFSDLPFPTSRPGPIRHEPSAVDPAPPTARTA